MTPNIIQPDEMPDTREYGYSQARVDADQLYISGVTGRKGDFIVAGDDIKTQARQAYANLETILAEVDLSLDDIAKVTTYVVDLPEHGDGYDAVWSETFDSAPYPCHTLVGVDALANPDYLVEIDVEAPLN